MSEFPISDDTMVVTTSYVTSQRLPILEVSHDDDEEGGSLWQFHCGNGDYSPDKLQLVRLSTILKLDPSVEEASNLAVGQQAVRTTIGGGWTVSKMQADVASLADNASSAPKAGGGHAKPVLGVVDDVPRGPVNSQHYSHSSTGRRLRKEAESFRHAANLDKHRNVATAEVSINGKNRTVRFKNDPGGLHSEQRLLSWFNRLQGRGDNVVVNSVYSDRAPCGPGSANCADTLGNAFGEFLEVWHGDYQMLLQREEDAAAFIKRTEHNVFTLQENLKSLGYAFASSDGAFALTDASDRTALEKFDEVWGPIPVMYRLLFTHFRFIDFRQSRQQLLEPNESQVAGLGLNCPLVFLPAALPSESIDARIQPERHGDQHFAPTGAVASNCTLKGVWLPDTSLDPVLYDDGAGPITMANEISTAMLAGGFPLWDKLTSKRRFTSPIANTPAYRKIRPVLTQRLILE